MTNRYCLEMSFDGGPFYGWQSQPHRNTVQDHTEAALEKIIGEKVRLVPASRTDTGVHAEQHFATFRVPNDTALPVNFIAKLNNLLPDTITAKRVERAKPGFHPRRHAKAKTYCYRLYLDDAPTSDTLRDHWRIYRALDMGILRAELDSVLGCHDFSAFCSAGSSINCKVRTIEDIRILEHGKSIEVWFTGDGFLKQMIRIIVGCAVERACGNPLAEPLVDILESRDRMRAKRTAPGQGLTLQQIHY